MGLIDNVNVNVGGNGNVIDTLSTYITKVLKPNIINGKNILSQDMMPIDTGANTKYVIKYDYELSEDITIPENCILEFDGGSISGAYTITGANTGINAGLVKVFNTDVILAGTWNVAEAYPEWFGAKGDGVTDDSSSVVICEFHICTSQVRAVAIDVAINGVFILNTHQEITLLFAHNFHVERYSLSIAFFAVDGDATLLDEVDIEVACGESEHDGCTVTCRQRWYFGWCDKRNELRKS
jgi:hypothetical protein